MKLLHQFEPDHGDFYVPAFTIKVGGRDLVRELFLSITNVEVELKLEAAGHFAFTVASAFDWEKREFLGKSSLEEIDLLELFAFGAQVEVSIGYGETAKLPRIITGIVTEIGTSFAESGTPSLNVSGYDALFELGLGATSRQWDRAKASEAVSEVAGKRSLPVKIDVEGEIAKRIDQSKESDFAFIGKMATGAKAVFYVRDGELRFVKRSNTADPVATLAWGQGLSSFSPTANLAKQVAGVEVHAWIGTEGKHVVGKAGRRDGEPIQNDTKSGSERIGEALSKTPILSISAPVGSQQEADDRAKAILEARTQDFVTGGGECVGLPVLLPDTNIEISGVGRAFNKKYYLTEVTHSIDGKGYRTRFKIGKPSV